MSFNLTTVGEFAIIQGGYAYKSNDFQSNGEWPVLKIKNIKAGFISYDDTNFVSHEIASATKKWITKEGDILISMTGSGPNAPDSLVGKVARVWKSEKPALINQRIGRLVLKDKNKIDPDFLFYLLSSKSCQDYLVSNSTGSANQVNISSKTIESVKCPHVNFATSKSIAAILRTLDERIRVLKSTNVDLEAIAQTLFKSWFIDFDPVRAKAEGRVPEGIDAETAALFPDSFAESELGLAPKGWIVTKVDDIAVIVKGKSYSSNDLTEKHSTALVTLKSFKRGGGFRLDGFKPYCGNYKPSQIIKPGDLIIAYTDVTQAAELIGKPAIVTGIEEYDVLVASLDVGIVRQKNESISLQFLYGLFKTDAFQAHSYAHTSGTTVLHLAKNATENFNFICPPQPILEKFTTIAEAISAHNQVNIDQIRALTEIRDILLPRLISGQLRLGEFEKLKEIA